MVRNDVVTIGTDVGFPADFIFAGEHIVIGTGVLGDWMRSVMPWITGGLIWGRPIVPSVGWVWSIVGFFFIVYLVVTLLLHDPVRTTTEELARRPFGTFMVGLLTLLLWAPIAALLAVTIVGLVVVPFVLCALVVAAVVGRVAVMRWIGDNLIAPGDPSNRAMALRSFVLGFSLLTLVYMVPVLGFVAWGLVGVFGLGAAVLAFLSAWRKESPRPTASTQPDPTSPNEHGALQVSAPYIPTPTPPTPPTPPSSVSLIRATFLDRAVAFGLDVMLVAIAHEGLRGTLFPRYVDFFFPLLLVYFIAFWTWKGTTVGGIIMKLRIIKISGARFEAADAIVRALAGALSFVALGIGVLWILRSDDLAPDGQPARQGWHDKAVGTWVIKDAPTQL
ncbi:MAG: RDD family protein [Acidimicrobiia bacterium]|nr:RDD family protein [Acidimicrobiia bacterium]